MDRGMLLIEHRTLFQISFKLEGKDIEIGEKYTCTYSRNGIVKLQINGFTAADVGTYECFAKNDYGEMDQPVIAFMAQYPGEIFNNQTISFSRKKLKKFFRKKLAKILGHLPDLVLPKP